MSDNIHDDTQPPRVGYRRPPVGTRFKKGQSGNPGGRPRKRGPVAVDMAALLNEPIKLRRGGRTKSVAIKEAQLRAMLKAAGAGDLDAVAYCLEQFEAHGAIRATQLEQGGAIQIPKTMPIGMGSLLVRFYGRPKQRTATGVPIWREDEMAVARERYLATRNEDERKEDTRIGYPDLATR